MSGPGQAGTVYLLHFDQPYKHARHYTGWTESSESLTVRLARHAAGDGARLLAVAHAAGITWQLARTWERPAGPGAADQAAGGRGPSLPAVRRQAAQDRDRGCRCQAGRWRRGVHPGPGRAGRGHVAPDQRVIRRADGYSRDGDVMVLAETFRWQDSAACRSGPPDLFFGAEGEQQHEKPAREAEAKAVCARCPVRVACLEDALASGVRFGVFGGTGEDERRMMRENLRRRMRAAERRAS